MTNNSPKIYVFSISISPQHSLETAQVSTQPFPLSNSHWKISGFRKRGNAWFCSVFFLFVIFTLNDNSNNNKKEVKEFNSSMAMNWTACFDSTRRGSSPDHMLWKHMVSFTPVGKVADADEIGGPILSAVFKIILWCHFDMYTGCHRHSSRCCE